MGCSTIRKLPKEFHALTPAVPIVECRFVESQAHTSGVTSLGCGWPREQISYIVYYNSQAHLIKSPQEFIQFFAPVDSPDEALAFALALTPSFAKYQIQIPPEYIRMMPDIRPTSAVKHDDGYTVNLYEYECQGCQLHPYYSVEYYVGKNGTVIETKRQPAYRDPREDNACVN